MNYKDAINKGIDFIETHINEELTAVQIANYVGYSVFHFCRIFAINQNIPLMEFVRKKRLLRSRTELLNNQGVTRTALEYGFETPSGFSKAFRKEFGYSPTSYISRVYGYGVKGAIANIGEIIMEPVIIKKKAFKVAGYGIHTNLAESCTKDIAAYWDTYTGNNLETKMYEQLSPPKHGEIGICVPCSDSGNAIYLFGVIVNDFEKVTPDMMTITVPAAEYAVFTTPPVNNIITAQTYNDDPLSIVIKETWRYIFDDWFSDSGYKFDESKMDFEFYDERCHGLKNAVIDIYVPIVRQNR